MIMHGGISEVFTRKDINSYGLTEEQFYSLPYEYEFKDDLPKTLVGKIAYRELEKEEKKVKTLNDVKDFDTSDKRVRRLLKRIQRKENRIVRLKNRLLKLVRR